MKALITGGGGFIGSHLAEALIAKGDEVCVIDNLSTGAVQNIEPLQRNERFSFINASVLDETLMEKAIDDCDIVYHLAAAVGVKYIMENRLTSFRVNVRGTEIVLELASRAQKKVMIASTSEVYGKNGHVPYSEDSDRVCGATTFHRWSYACTKALDEFLALAYWEERDLPIVIARFFNTVGPRQVGRYGMVIPRFVESAIKNEPLTVHGDGTQTRCFTYVGDVVKAIIALSECPEAEGEVFNIGNNKEISIDALARKIIELTDSRSTIQYIPYEEAFGKGFEDMKRRVPDISKIYAFVGWKPEVELEKMLMQIIDHFRQRFTPHRLPNLSEKGVWYPRQELSESIINR